MHWSRGMQEGEQDKYTKVVSTGKHFVDYDQEGNGGVDRGNFNAIVNDQDQVEYYFPAWRADSDHCASAWNAVALRLRHGWPGPAHRWPVPDRGWPGLASGGQARRAHFP